MRRQRRFSGKPRRQLEWEWARPTFTGLDVGINGLTCQWARVPAACVDTFQGPLPGGMVIEEDYTLVKTRIDWCAHVFNTLAGTELYVSMGLIRWTGIDDLPPTEYPDVRFDGAADWIFRVAVPVSANTAAGLLISPSVESNHVVKSQRKLSQNQGLLWIAGIDDDGSSVAGSNVQADIRMLLKEN